MGDFLINTFMVLIAVLVIGYLWMKAHPDFFDRKLAEKAKENRQKFVKDSSELHGKRMTVPRDDKPGVRVTLYEPRGIRKDSYPVVFMAHGGTFMDGDSDQLDTMCERLAVNWERIIVNINYTKLDEQKFPYPQEEIRDTVLYFGIHSSEFSMDASRFSFMGFSAGAYLEIGAAALLKEKGFRLKGMIAVAPFVDDAMIRLCDVGAHVSPYTLVTTDTDPMKDRYSVYLDHLKSGGVEVNQRNIEDAVSGFLEHNNEEFETNPLYAKSKAISDDQKELARAIEVSLGTDLSRMEENK